MDSNNEIEYEVVIKGQIAGVPDHMLRQYFNQSIQFSMNMAATVRHVDINLKPKSQILKPDTPIT